MIDETYIVAPIGYVQSSLTDPDTAPKQGGEGARVAWLIFNATVRDGLRDLQVGDDVLLLTWLDRSQRDVLLVHPRDDPAQPLRGVFSTRSADRPNLGMRRGGRKYADWGNFPHRGERDGERRPLPGDARHGNRTAMSLNNVFHNG